MTNKPRSLGLYFALSVIALMGLTHLTDAALPVTPGSQALTYLTNFFSDKGGKLRIDTVNNQYVFGSTAPATGAILTSSGTVVIQSTSATSGHKILRLLNYARTELMSLTQGGSLSVPGSITAGSFIGDGSALTGVGGVASTNTWTAPQFYSNSVDISSPSASLVVGSSLTINGGVFSNGRIHNSSFTHVPDFSTTQATFVVGFATVTHLVGDNPLALVFSGSCLNGTNGASMGLGVLIDGQFAPGVSLTQGYVNCEYPTGGLNCNASFYRVIPSQGAGTKNFTLTANSPNTGTSSCGDVDGAGSYNTSLSFGVIELK